MEMVEVKTAELTGPALDRAVAIADGVPLEKIDGAFFVPWGLNVPGCAKSGTTAWRPSTDWAQAGALIEKYEVTVYPPRHLVRKDEGWGAEIYLVNHPKILRGETPLIAACRAIVAAKLGDTVQVPAELAR